MSSFLLFYLGNFRYQKNICDGSHHCIIYENENENLIFRVNTIEKGTYRTVSSYFLTEVENILERIDIENRKFVGVYKKDLKSIVKQKLIKLNEKILPNNV